MDNNMNYQQPQQNTNDQLPVDCNYQQPTVAQPNNIFTKGLVALILAYCVPPVGLILAIIARKAIKAYTNAGNMLVGKAKTGSILALIGLILGIVGTVGVGILLAYWVIYIIWAIAYISSSAF